MEPVETSEPVDLGNDPHHEKGAESHGRMASMPMLHEGRDGSRETADAVDSEENDARNQEGGEGRRGELTGSASARVASDLLPSRPRQQNGVSVERKPRPPDGWPPALTPEDS